MSSQETVLVVAIVSTLIPVVAILLRERSAYMIVPALITGMACAVDLAVVMRLVQLGPDPPEVVSRILIGASFVALLGGYVLSSCFGRADLAASFRQCRRTLVLIAVVGVALLSLLGSRSFIAAYTWEHDRGTIILGAAGRLYLTYALVTVILIGYNLEKTYRIAAPDARRGLRLPLLATFAALFYGTFLLTMGLLYSAMGIGKFVAAALPITIVNVAVGYGYLKGQLSDVSAPVSRTIVYSSFTAMTAGLFVAAIGLAGQVAGWTHSSPDEILVLACGILIVLATALLIFSNRFQRQVRRFIDRNFYVNRYDYRTQWSKVATAFVAASDRGQVLDAAVKLLEEIFQADGVTIALADRSSEGIRPIRGKGEGGSQEPVLSVGSPLHLMLCEERKALLIDRRVDDFTYIPVYAENGDWLERTASQIIAPLLEGERVFGIIGLARSNADDPLTYEDVALLDSVAAHVASALRSAEMSEELAETREVELISNLSSMILHDLKNYVSPLRLAAGNLERFKDEPAAVVTCANDVKNVADRMTGLVRMFSDLRRNTQLAMESVDPNDLIRDALDSAGIQWRSMIDLQLQLDATRRVQGDRDMLRRVLHNLVCNAIEAMPNGGRLTLRTKDIDRDGSSSVVLSVEDNGVGMSREFLRDRLFHPFATTKKKGLGLGLYQCRSIVRTHGGQLTAESSPGQGALFTMVLTADAPTLEARATAQAVGGRIVTRELADGRV